MYFNLMLCMCPHIVELVCMCIHTQTAYNTIQYGLHVFIWQNHIVTILSCNELRITPATLSTLLYLLPSLALVGLLRSKFVQE